MKVSIMKSKQQAGFTLVELVVTIVLLGILAATALPRFLDVTGQAQSAALEGVAGGFGSGVALAKAQWTADGNSRGTAGAEVVLDGDSLFANENGWPANTSNTSSTDPANQTAAECLEIWEFILQNPPPATTAATVTGFDYQVAFASPVCQFNYVINDAVDTTRNFTYDLNNGRIAITIP
jgi:MSHA pilin protein MshB